MAFSSTNFCLMTHGNGFNHYRYDSTEAPGTIDADGYINNVDDNQDLDVGDMITAVQWSTAVRTGTVSDVSMHVVTNIGSDGDVNLSDDLLGATVASGD